MNNARPQMLHPAGFIVLRTPSMSWDVVERWTDGLSLSQIVAPCDDSDAVRCGQVRALRTRLRAIVQRPDVRAALYIASPGLFARMASLSAGENNERTLGVETALVRYIMRMAGRATPFGLFAATAVGRVDRTTQLAVTASERRRHVRLDAGYVFHLARWIAGRYDSRSGLRFRAAPAAYRIGGRLRYYEARDFSAGRRFSLVDVEHSPHLDAALRCASTQRGATIAEVSEAIVNHCHDVSTAEAQQFVEALVDGSLLQDTLAPSVTADDPALDLTLRLREVGVAPEIATALERISLTLRSDEAARNAFTPEDYRGVLEPLQSVTAASGLVATLRVDFNTPTAGVTIGRHVAEEVGRAVQLLARVAAPPPDAALDRFVRDFELRYHGTEVPLLEALDEESGVGFGIEGHAGADDSSLLREIAFERPRHTPIGWNRRSALLLDKLTEALHKGAHEIQLSRTDVTALASNSARPSPCGLSALVTIGAPSAEAIDRGDYRIYLRKVFGPNSAKLLGRFCAGSPELRAHVEAALRAEEAHDPAALHAEIVHLPHPHAGNAIGRPVLRKYEIPVFDGSAASAHHQIALDDLWVSVDGNTVCLRSSRHNRKVVPHLSCAHAFRTSGIGLYRFLASLEAQGTWSELSFSWGPLASAPFLPRVVHGRFVLALAQWRLSGEQLQRLDQPRLAASVRAAQDLRARLELPRLVWLVDADNTLPIDFDNALSLHSFVRTVRRRSHVVLSEVFPARDEMPATGADGRFDHEMVIPFVRPVFQHRIDTRAPSTANRRYAQRRHYPGGEWLFLKLYAGAVTMERVLIEVVAPLVCELREAGVIDRWFFVRQADPRRHLRLRLHGNAALLWRDVAPRVLADLSRDDNLVTSVVVDTYVPEEARYGGPRSLPLVEQIFETDSDTAIRLLEHYRFSAEARWRLALIGMNTLLNAARLDTDAKRLVADACRRQQIAHHPEFARLRRKIGERYRRLRPDVDGLLHGQLVGLDIGAEPIATRAHRLAPVLKSIRQLADEGELTVPLTTLLASCLHMWANRMFRDAANAHELVLYEFLYRSYDAALANPHTRS